MKQSKIKGGAQGGIRLFPRFKEGDSAAWESVLKRARDGADHPFQPTGHTDATEKHPVCLQVASTIGSGKVGTDIRKALRAAPFGWPQDAIDAALIALHRAQHLRVTLNGASVPLGQLDQNKIAKAEFRVEHATISVSDRLVLRKLFGIAGVSCRSGEEAMKAPEFVTTLISLARSVGGDAPLPPLPSTTVFEDLSRLGGNEQLAAIRAQSATFETRLKEWAAARDLVAQRRPAWELTIRLARQAASLPEAKTFQEQLDAIIAHRSLLQPQDPSIPIRRELADVLRAQVQQLYQSFSAAFKSGTADLEALDVWQCTAPDVRRRLIDASGLSLPSAPAVSTDETLAATLEATPLSWWRDKLAALGGRFAQVAVEAAKLLEPKVQHVRLASATLRTESDVRAWLATQEQTLLAKIKDGPVVVS